MNKCSLSIICFGLMVGPACTDKKDMQVKNQIEIMSKYTLHIPFDSLVCLQSRIVIDDKVRYSNSKYKIIEYYDLYHCNICRITKMTMWNEYLFRNKYISSAFIFEASSSEIEELRTTYDETGLDHPIYIDTCGAFRRENPFIPNNALFHTMLLNEADSIILVGSPFRNQKIADLYKRVLGEMDK